VSANSCPRCQKVLPELTLRALAQGTSCPFCAAPLKRTPRSATATATATAKSASADDGYAAFEVGPAPPPAPPAKSAPATTAASPKSFKATMVGGTAVAARSMPFEGTPAAEPFSLAPPVAVSARPATATAKAAAPEPSIRAVSAPASTPPVRGGGAAALARTIAAPAPQRTPGARPAVAPAASKPHRTLTPAQALDLPPPTPAPVLKTPPPIASIPPRGAVVEARSSEADSEPTSVSPQQARIPAAPGPLVTDSESGPTNIVLPMPEPAAAEPVLKFPDSEPVIDSVTVAPDPEPRPVPPVMLRVPPEAPRRGMALVGLGMGLAIVALAIVGFKLLRGSRTTAVPATTVAASAPAPVEPAVPAIEAVPSAPEPAKAPPPRQAASGPTAKTKSKAKAAPAAEPVPEKHVAVSHRRRHLAEKIKKPHHERRVARAVAARQPAAKRGAAPAAPAEHADPRPPYEHGNALLFAGDGKGALAAYREAVRSAPNDPIGFRGLGLAYEQQGESAQAIKALRRYLKLAPDAPDRELIAKRIEKISKRAKQK